MAIIYLYVDEKYIRFFYVTQEKEINKIGLLMQLIERKHI